MDINDIRTWRKHLFLDISSTSNTLDLYRYQRVSTRSINMFYCCLNHFRTSVSTSSSSAKHLPPRLNRFTRQKLPTVNRKHFFMNIVRIESFCPPPKKKKTRTQQNTALQQYTLKNGRVLSTEISIMRMRIAALTVMNVDCSAA
jgi:hypothetical protein